MDTVTFAITLPVRGTAYDYQRALVDEIGKAPADSWKAKALGGLVGTILAPSPTWPWNHPQAPTRTAGNTL